jgi:hypothetical protein
MVRGGHLAKLALREWAERLTSNREFAALLLRRLIGAGPDADGRSI